MKALPLPCLMLVTEPNLNLVQIVTQAVTGGVNVVQLRASETTSEASWEFLNATWQLTEPVQKKALVIINYWPWLVRKTDADGAHLPEASPFDHDFVRSMVLDGLVGRSVHSIERAISAEQEGVDYLVAGTIFPSQSHPEIAPQGLGFLQEVCRSVNIPVIAIGGILPEHVADCVEAGAAGIALLSPIMRAQDPQAAARRYRDALDKAWEKHRCN